MRILLVTSYFPPELGAASDLYFDLAEAFADRGHEVEVVTRFPHYRLQRAESGLFRRDRVGRAEVIRIATLQLAEAGRLLRGLDHLVQPPMYLIGGLMARRPDVILFHSPPLTLGLACWALAKRWGVPYVANIQDLFPKYAVDIGLLTNPLLIRAFETLERFVYRTADAVTVNAPHNTQHILEHGGAPERVETTSNWIDVDVVTPGTRENAFRERVGLGEAFVVQYTGTMGFQQDLDTILGAADILKGETGIRFVLIGDGVERERLEQSAAQRALSNVLFLPYQPREEFPQVLQAADAGVVTLRADVDSPTVPSKLLGIMAAGRPVLISAPLHGDAPRIVQDAGAGVCVPPGRPECFAEAVLRLSRDPKEAAAMGRRGRAYAEEHFSRHAAAAQYEALFERLVAVRRLRWREEPPEAG
jgi:glycosyltransferase involved in cell wall biosynthesis